MNIQNIQIAQGLSRTVEERLNSRKEKVSSPSGVSLPQVNLPDATDNNAKVSGEKDLLQVVYPPFFPIGNTQDILLIKGVNLEGKAAAEKSAAIVARDEQKAQKEIDNKATNADTGAVRHDNAQSTAAPAKGETPPVKHQTNPGVALDLKV